MDEGEEEERRRKKEELSHAKIKQKNASLTVEQERVTPPSGGQRSSTKNRKKSMYPFISFRSGFITPSALTRKRGPPRTIGQVSTEKSFDWS